jgi:mannose-6-phosphate isomerase-like protein (cupin superfamily)
MPIRVLRVAQAELLGPEDGAQDRFLLGGADTNGHVSLVEHHAPPGTLIAPLHRHTREDEFSLVLEGRMGVVSDGEEIEVEAGCLVWKPRNAWHTFWNAGDGPVRILEVISPAGLEELFRTIDGLQAFPDPDELERLAAPYGLDIDMEGTMAVLERHGLRF